MSTKRAQKAVTKKKAEKPRVSKKSKKKEVVKEKKEAPVAKVEALAKEREQPEHLFRPTASIPHPRVSIRHDGSVKVRDAKGYSLGELAAANVQPWVARRWGVPVDTRRRSTISGNAQSLKSWFQAGEYAKPASLSKSGTSKKE